MPLTIEDRSLSAGDFIPFSDDAYDLGEITTPRAWKDAYIDGKVYTDTITEFGSGVGVTVEGVTLKDSYISFVEATLPAGAG